MDVPNPPPQSQDIAGAITAAGFMIAGAIAAVGFGALWFFDSIFHQALPWIPPH